MFQLRVLVAVVLSLLAIVFVIQNTEVVEVRFLFWQLSMSRVILILITVGLGFLLGVLVSSFGGGGSRRSAAGG